MPHNLYLHSSIVQSHSDPSHRRVTSQSIRYATVDSNIALGLALMVNAGILVLAAGAFHRSGGHAISSLADAYQLLSPVLGVGAASTVFGIGLIASGLSSSVTGTLAGQIVMEGFLDLHVSRGVRAALTRSLALLPAAAAVYWLGEAGVGKLLILSQVILGLQLPFAVVPLLWFTTRRKYLGPHVFRGVSRVLLWGTATLVTLVNLWVLYQISHRP